MLNTHKKVIKESWCKGMKYANLIYENGLLIIRQVQCNSETLINDIIDTCNRLAKECKREKDMRR